MQKVKKLNNYDTTIDFSIDGMLQCRQRHRVNESLCHKSGEDL